MKNEALESEWYAIYRRHLEVIESAVRGCALLDLTSNVSLRGKIFEVDAYDLEKGLIWLTPKDDSPPEPEPEP